MRDLWASVIVNNYNYARFLRPCIDSALAQTYPRVEVIVVDDGSTDGSRDIMASYGNAVQPLLKENAGQASAFNAGFEICRGDVIVFLDADDLLLPDAVANAVVQFEAWPGSSKVHWPLQEIDETGTLTGQLVPSYDLPEGDLRQAVIDRGPLDHAHSPTSGNAWSRRFLREVLPVQEWGDKHGADAYLVTLAPIFGRVSKVAEPQSLYRRHAHNFSRRDIRAELQLDISRHRKMSAALREFLSRQGVAADLSRWTGAGSAYAWMVEMLELPAAIEAALPPGSRVLFVDDDQLGSGFVSGRVSIPFLEVGGVYGGQPADADAAIQELERQRRAGAEYIVFIRSTLWWLEHFAEFGQYLRTHYACPVDSGSLTIFDLREASR